MAPMSVVVIPARDEEDTIAACLSALARQTVGPEAFEIDPRRRRLHATTTETVARAAAQRLGLAAHRAARARRRLGAGAASGHGCRRRPARSARTRRRPDRHHRRRLRRRPRIGWPGSWRTWRAARAVVAGLIELDPEDVARLPAAVRERRERDARRRLADVARPRSRGRAPPLRRRVAGGDRRDLPARRRPGRDARRSRTRRSAPSWRATASRWSGPPTCGCAPRPAPTGARARGLSVDLAVSTWREQRRYRRRRVHAGGPARAPSRPRRCRWSSRQGVRRHHRGGPGDHGRAARGRRGSSTRSSSSTPRRATAPRRARRRWARSSCSRTSCCPSTGRRWARATPCGGRVASQPRRRRLLPGRRHRGSPSSPSPGAARPAARTTRRWRWSRARSTVRFAPEARDLPHEGGRVTEVMARPAAQPALPAAGRLRPAAGGRVRRPPRAAEAHPVPGGLRGGDRRAHRRAATPAGSQALAECHLGTRQNRHQPLRALGEMAFAVLAAVERRLDGPRSATGGHYLRPVGGRRRRARARRRAPAAGLAERLRPGRDGDRCDDRIGAVRVAGVGGPGASRSAPRSTWC